MKRKLLNLIAVLVLIATPTTLPLVAYAATAPAKAPAAAPAKASAASTACTGTGDTTKDQVLGGVGDVGGKCADSGATSIFKTVTNILSLVAGAVAVIMVMISGFKYVTSGGDANKVASAKSTLVFALIGIAIAALAQTLVHFVINKV